MAAYLWNPPRSGLRFGVRVAARNRRANAQVSGRDVLDLIQDCCLSEATLLHPCDARRPWTR